MKSLISRLADKVIDAAGDPSIHIRALCFLLFSGALLAIVTGFVWLIILVAGLNIPSEWTVAALIVATCYMLAYMGGPR